jgi:putrescine transport system permease protein
MTKFLKDLLTLRWLSGRGLVISVPYLWLVGAFLIPFLIVARISFSEVDAGNPFGSLMTYAEGVINFKIKVSNYLFIANDELYVLTYLSSL